MLSICSVKYSLVLTRSFSSKVEIFSQLNIKLDKRKLDLENSISSLGTYEIPIQLHKDVVAKIKLFVVEEQ